MTPRRPPYLVREQTRHGGVKWYVRIGKGPRIRVAAFGTPQFDAEYEAALTGEPKRPRGAPAAGTLGWLMGPLQRNHCVDDALTGDQEAAREHLAPGYRECRRPAGEQSHGGRS